MERSHAGGEPLRPAWARGRVLAVSFCLAFACPCNGSNSGGTTSSGTTSPSAEDNDRVSILMGGAPTVLSVKGKGRTKCLTNELFEGTGVIDLKDRVESTGCGGSEVVGFAGDRAVELNGAPAWSHDPVHPVELTLKDPLEVQLRFYVPQGSGVDTDAQDEMDIATGLFAKNRVGLKFTSVSTLEYTPTQAVSIGNRCNEVANLVQAGPTLYDPARINVYYVSQIDNSMYLLGYNCFERSITVGGNPAIGENVIFLSLARRVNTTLAHELGHAFGLRGSVGHTLGMAGFTKRNLMMTGIDLNDQAAQDHFSLGQAYRMSLDRLSWMNHPRPDGGAQLRVGGNRGCQSTASAAVGDPCPPLAWDK